MITDIFIIVWNGCTWVVALVLSLPIKFIKFLRKLFVPKRKPRKF